MYIIIIAAIVLAAAAFATYLKAKGYSQKQYTDRLCGKGDF